QVCLTSRTSSTKSKSSAGLSPKAPTSLSPRSRRNSNLAQASGLNRRSLVAGDSRRNFVFFMGIVSTTIRTKGTGQTIRANLRFTEGTFLQATVTKVFVASGAGQKAAQAIGFAAIAA